MLLAGTVSVGFSLLLLPSHRLGGNTSKTSCTRSHSHVHHAFNHVHNQEAGGRRVAWGGSILRARAASLPRRGVQSHGVLGWARAGCWGITPSSRVLAVPSMVPVHRSSMAEPQSMSSPKTHLSAAGADPC